MDPFILVAVQVGCGDRRRTGASAPATSPDDSGRQCSLSGNKVGKLKLQSMLVVEVPCTSHSRAPTVAFRPFARYPCPCACSWTHRISDRSLREWQPPCLPCPL